MEIQNNTEVKGPFHVEWNGDTALVRCKQPFRWQITLHRQAKRQGGMYASEPIALKRGMSLVLSTVGHDDEVVEGR